MAFEAKTGIETSDRWYIQAVFTFLEDELLEDQIGLSKVTKRESQVGHDVNRRRTLELSRSTPGLGITLVTLTTYFEHQINPGTIDYLIK
jgi:hypothetical protein